MLQKPRGDSGYLPDRAIAFRDQVVKIIAGYDGEDPE
jgi:hypothetical protein